MVYNLINNALTYIGEDKTVTIKQIHIPAVNGKQNRVRIEVIDTGEGIEQSKLNDIWDRYYKVDKNHKRAAIGTGLGLNIVKTIFRYASRCNLWCKKSSRSRKYFLV